MYYLKLFRKEGSLSFLLSHFFNISPSFFDKWAKRHKYNFYNRTSCDVAQGHKDVTVSRWLWIRSPLGGMNYHFLIFSFLSSGTKPKIPALSSAT